MKDKIFTIPQAAKHCAISRWTLLKCVQSGELKASRTPGGHYRILKEDLEGFIVKKGMYPLAYKRFSKKSILIVDDDKDVQELLTKILSDHNYKTEVASSGFEAGAKLVKFKPGLIILDLIMPEMSGFDVCRRIKEDPDMSHIKIIALTGYDTEQNRKKIMEAGADGYLAKPVEIDVLLRHIEDLLGATAAHP